MLAETRYRKIQAPPDFMVKLQAFDIVGVVFGWYDEPTSWINGKSRHERPSPFETLRLPRNPAFSGQRETTPCCRSFGVQILDASAVSRYEGVRQFVDRAGSDSGGEVGRPP